MTKNKEIHKSVRLSTEDNKLFKALEKKLGANFAQVMRQAIRVYAEQQGLR